MKTDAPLRTRHQEILNAIVRAYIETGEPVGSRTISKRRSQDLSPASIRNVMADLADEGYLSQPHTSAGRMPTEKAFRFYVRARWPRRAWLLAEAERLREEFSGLHTVGGARGAVQPHPDGVDAQRGHRRRHSGAGPGTGPDRAGAAGRPARADDSGDARPHGAQPRGGAGRSRLRRTSCSPSATTSTAISPAGSLGEARRELLRRMLEERALYDAVMRKLQVLYQKGLLDVDTSPEVHMEGASNLLGLDLHLTREKMRELLRALEEKKRLIELLDRFLERPRANWKCTWAWKKRIRP